MWSSCLKTNSTTSSAKSPDASAESRGGALRRMNGFVGRMKAGLHVEWRETRAIPGQLIRGEFRRAGEQVADLGRMGFLAVLWVLPGGAVISGVAVKLFRRIRPSAFRET